MHLHALQFRPDGLLLSATRYPRLADEPWTPTESKVGMYNYELRIIDCLTGFHVETGFELIDKFGKKFALQTYGVQKMAENLVEQVTQGSPHSWPSKNEILLACVAASHPTLKAQRAKMARAVVPLISHKPLTEALVNESEKLFERAQLRYDVQAIQRRNPASALSVFDQLRQQYITWRQAIYKPYDALSASRTPSLQVQTAVRERMKKMSGSTDTVRMIGNGIIEYTLRMQIGWHEEVPKKAAVAYSRRLTVRADCDSGVSMPLEQAWYDERDQLLLRTAFTARNAIKYAQETFAHQTQNEINLWLGMEDYAVASEVCALAARASRTQAGQLTQEGRGEHSEPLDSSERLSVAQLAQEKTPEAMLLKIRALLREW